MGRKRGRPKISERKIEEALEKGPKTFEDLVIETGLARTSLSECLSKMEEEGKIIRKVAPPLERGPGKRYRILIELVDNTPVGRTLRHLSNISSLIQLDVEKGKEILTNDVIDTILVISSLEIRRSKKGKLLDCPHSQSFACYREWMEETKEMRETLEGGLKTQYQLFEYSLNEAELIRGLARFNWELLRTELETLFTYLVSEIPLHPGTREAWTYALKKPEELEEFFKDKRDDPEIFPALNVARNYNTTRQLEELLEWIRPVVEGPEISRVREVYQKDRKKFYEIYGMPYSKISSFEIKAIACCGTNLVATLFKQEERSYEEHVLIPLWVPKMRLYIKKKRRGKK